mmetsp:Transcript_8531/g.14937  ORF Transcript_8531/g.14937 Transcript_8531/m.14937 type:complete len:97 (-) Transcript_8531:46-336(-)
MEDLESRVRALEQGRTFAATQQRIREREAEFLSTLREIKYSLEQETSGNEGGSGKFAELQAENTELKAKLAKAEYRISHLVGEMEKLLARRKEDDG